MGAMATNLSALMIFKTETETEKVVEDKSREVSRWRTRTLVAVAFGLAGIVFTLIQIIL